MDDIHAIKRTLQARRPRTAGEAYSHYMHSAVLIPLFIENGGYNILFTERSHNVEHHKGQISFPGGVVDKRDRSFLETALRESYEEIGLLSKDVEILGPLDEECTVTSNFVIHPFAGLIPYPYPFKINRDEVESLIAIPIRSLSAKQEHVSLDDLTYHGTVYEYGGYTIWGATASITENLISIINKNLSLPEKGE
jgi:8-oxo-dGTP pyrophosphatase MutT (NUDIX family)